MLRPLILIFPFNPHNNSVRKLLLICIFKQGNRGFITPPLETLVPAGQHLLTSLFQTSQICSPTSSFRSSTLRLLNASCSYSLFLFLSHLFNQFAMLNSVRWNNKSGFYFLLREQKSTFSSISMSCFYHGPGIMLSTKDIKMKKTKALTSGPLIS